MTKAILAISGSAAALLPRPVTGLSQSVAAYLLELITELLDPYRPELHYMRGPGPKWHAKHGPPPLSHN
jgi:hypothetical protein